MWVAGETVWSSLTRATLGALEMSILMKKHHKKCPILILIRPET